MNEFVLTKRQAISIFGSLARDLSQALGITDAAICKWPDQLTARRTNEVLGAAIRRYNNGGLTDFGRCLVADFVRDSNQGRKPGPEPR